MPNSTAKAKLMGSIGISAVRHIHTLSTWKHNQPLGHTRLHRRGHYSIEPVKSLSLSEDRVGHLGHRLDFTLFVKRLIYGQLLRLGDRNLWLNQTSSWP